MMTVWCSGNGPSVVCQDHGKRGVLDHRKPRWYVSGPMNGLRVSKVDSSLKVVVFKFGVLSR